MKKDAIYLQANKSENLKVLFQLTSTVHCRTQTATQLKFKDATRHPNLLGEF